MQAWGAYAPAASSYQELLAKHPGDRQLRLKFADTLVSLERLTEATAIYEELATEFKRSPDIHLNWAQARLLQNRPAEALEIVNRGLADSPSDARLLILKGEIQTRLNAPEEALKAYSCAASDKVHAEIGLHKKAELLTLLGRNEEASQILKSTGARVDAEASLLQVGLPEATKEEFVTKIVEDTSLVAPDFDAWARAYVSHSQNRIAIRLLREARTRDDSYIPSQLLLAELLAIEGYYDESLSLYDSLLTAFPESSKLTIGRARALSYAKRFEESIAAFQNASENDQIGYTALREAARVHYWAHQMDEASATYTSAATLCSNEEVKKAIILERDAKLLFWNRQVETARGTYDQLLKLEPANKEALFDLAQVNCAIGQRHEAVETYDKLIALEPYHKVAPEARERLILQDRPSLIAQGSWFSEDGRGELVQMTHYTSSLGTEVPLNDAVALSFLANAWREDIHDGGNDYTSVGPTLGIQGRINPDLTGKVRWTHRFYNDDTIDDRDTGSAGLWYRTSDSILLGLEYDRVDEISNQFALSRAVQSDNATLSVRSFIGRDFELVARARQIFYTDSNNGQFASISGTQTLSDEPRVFRVGIVSEYRDVQEDSIFVPGPTGLQDIIHPYWTPNNYFSGGVAFDWTEELNEVIYCMQRRHYFRIRLTPSASSDGNAGFQLAGEWGLDLPQDFGLGVQGFIQRSQLYDADQALVSLRYAF